MTGLTLAPGQSCDVAVDVFGAAAGRFTSRIDQARSDQLGPGPMDASAVLVIKGPPAVTTGEGRTTAIRSATLTGSVRPNSAETEFWFEYGLDSFYGARTSSVRVPASDEWLGVTNALQGLRPGTVYHYRLVASNEVGQTFGADLVVWTMSTGAGSALTLNGTNAFLATLDLTTAFTNETFTIELWFRARGPGVLVDERGQAPTAPGWQDSQLEIVATGELRARVWNLPTLVVGPVAFDQWHHAAIRYAKSTALFTCLLDGVEGPEAVTGDRTAPAEAGYRQFWAFGLGDSAHLGYGGYFQGDIDEIRIWNVARTTLDIRAKIYQRLYGTESGLACYWRLDDGAGLQALDATGHGHAAVLSPSAVWGASTAPIQDSLWIYRLGDGSVELLLLGYPAQPYVFSASTNLLDWQPLQTNVTSANGRSAWIDSSASRPSARFYRALVP